VVVRDTPAALLLVAGRGKIQVVPIDADEIVIGRDASCQVAIDDRAFSRRHAVLRRAPLSITDLGSVNGLKLPSGILRDGASAPLAVGDAFHIGEFSFLVLSGTTADPSSHRSGRERLTVDDPTPEGVSSFVREIARSGINVVIQGETGVGKEVLASTLHALSGRGGPMSSINCAALTENLLENELFGHEKGAFTGAVAMKPGVLEATSGGTVFLDELGELPLAIQAKLLRAVETREVRRVGATRATPVDVRIVAATNRDLVDEVAAGRFREDLLFRLDGVTLRIPPLRERPAAITTLALRFIEESSRKLGRASAVASAELLAALAAHDWPGNVRELKATIERAVLLARGPQLAPRHLAFTTRRAPGTAPPPDGPAAAPADELGFLSAEERAERDRIVAALDEHGGNQTRAAEKLGMSRSALINKIAVYRIPRPRMR
jgi:two-component system response regulator AtoC